MSLEGLDEEYLARRAELPECVVCERPMRPAQTKAADWPATMAYGTASQCKTCYNRVYNNKKALSAYQASRVKTVKVRQGRGQGYVKVPSIVLPKPEVATRWTDEQKAAASVLTGAAIRADIPYADNAKELEHVLDMLGFWETDVRSGSGTLPNFRADGQ